VHSSPSLPVKPLAATRSDASVCYGPRIFSVFLFQPCVFCRCGIERCGHVTFSAAWILSSFSFRPSDPSGETYATWHPSGPLSLSFLPLLSCVLCPSRCPFSAFVASDGKEEPFAILIAFCPLYLDPVHTPLRPPIPRVLTSNLLQVRTLCHSFFGPSPLPLLFYTVSLSFFSCRFCFSDEWQPVRFDSFFGNFPTLIPFFFG